MALTVLKWNLEGGDNESVFHPSKLSDKALVMLHSPSGGGEEEGLRQSLALIPSHLCSHPRVPYIPLFYQKRHAEVLEL